MKNTHALIEAQLTICRDYRTRQQVQAEALDTKSFEFLVLSSKLTAAESTLTWLQELAGAKTGRPRVKAQKRLRKATTA